MRKRVGAGGLMDNHCLTNRVASLLIIASLLFSSGSGLLLFWGSSGSEALLPWEQGGDRIIGTDYQESNWVISGYDMTGNLTIRNGGTVTVSDGALMFSQNLGTDGIPDTSDDHIYVLIIEDGGKLVLNNATLTTNLNQVHAYPSLAVIVRNGGVLEAHNSILKFPGYLIVDDASLILDNSVVTGFTPTEIATYCDSRYFPVENSTSAFDDSPVMLLMSANVVMSDSRIEKVFEPANGISSSTYSHVYPFVNGTVGGALTNYVLNRMPATVAGGAGVLSDLTMDDLKTYNLAKGQTLNINGIDIGGLVFSSIDGVTASLNIKYSTSAGFTGGAQAVRWNFLGSSTIHTAMVPTDTTTDLSNPNKQFTMSTALPSMSSADLSKLHISYQNSDPGTASIFINEIWVSLTMPLSTYKNITLAGSTQMTAINTYLGVDFANDTLLHNVLAVCDNSNAYMYGVSVDMSQDPTPLSLREAAFVAVERTIDASPVTLGPNNTAGTTIGQLAADEDVFFQVPAGQVMEINALNVSGLSGNIQDAVLKVRYTTTSTYRLDGNYVQWAQADGAYRNTAIRPARTTNELIAQYDLSDLAGKSISEISNLNIRFANNDPSQIAYFDMVWVEVTLKPTIYIYRWAEINVTDTQSLPVPGATVDIVLQNSTDQRPVYYPSGSTVYFPPADVLNYLGRTEANFGETGENGRAYIPVLSQVLDRTNPYPKDSISYFLTVTYQDANGSIYQNSSAVSFLGYPQMDANNQTVAIDMVLSDLILIGGYDLIIDGSADPLHDNLTLVGTEIPINGNVIVKSHGMLTLDNAALRILQPMSGNPRYIVIEDMGQIILKNNANIFSDANVTMLMSGSATLSLSGSMLDSSIVVNAGDDAVMKVENSSVAADITTAPLSRAVITASNTTFTTAWSSFGGSATAYLANVSIPSLAPREDAVVYHYRWINVVVEDSTGQPLPGSTVELELLTGVHYASATCDGNGAVLFKALCDIVDSSGPQFVGNYRVNATFWFAGEPYYNATGWMDVSLQPYMPPAPLTSSVKVVAIVIDEGLAEVVVQMNGISITPAVPTVDNTATIEVTVWNNGDTDAAEVIVTFNYSSLATGTGVIGTDTIDLIPAKSSAHANIAWTPMVAGDYTITVWAESDPPIQETNKINNEASVPVHVNNLPDIQFTDISIYPGNTVDVGDNVRAEASVINNGETTAYGIIVRFYIGDTVNGLNFDNKTIPALVPGQSESVTSILWLATISDGSPSQSYQISVAFNPERTIAEMDYDNNNGSKTLTVNDDRPDLMFVGGSLSIKNLTQEVTDAEIGKSVNITVQVRNNGTSNAMSPQLVFYAVNATDPLNSVEIGNITQSVIYATTTISIYKVWVVNVSMGAWNIVVYADPRDLVDEMSEANNIIIKNVTITAPTPYITLFLDKAQYKGGDVITVSGTVKAAINGIALPGMPVNVSLYSNGVRVNSVEVLTNANGVYSASMLIPNDATGSVEVRVTAGYSGHVSQMNQPIEVNTFIETAVPWWIYAFIIMFVAAIIIFFSMYLYRYSLSRMVECGECGALIPESSKKCPKCGTEFELGTVKCSECGAWIPADSKICPECKAKFVGEALPEQEDPYIKSMREQYDAFVDSYKDEARAALGKKYSDAKFADWWKKQPAYISFEDWLSQEEMKRKSSAFPCPVCGTPNAKGATECHKCGTVFEAPKLEEKKEEEKPKVRRMIKRPAQKPPAEKPAEPAPTEEEKQEEK